MKQGKYNEAETLYKLILTRAFDMGVGAKTAKPLWQVAEDLEVTIVTNMVVRKVYMCIASMLTCLVQAGEANESEIFRDMSRPVASNER